MNPIFLVRHGETDWNKDLRLMGNLKIPINDRGAEQISRLCPFFKERRPAKLFTSPLVRTLQSAEILGRALGLEVIPDERITEVQFGHWEGRPYAELIQLPEFQGYFARPAENKIPDAEDIKSVQHRAVDFIKELWNNERKGSAIAVTHADVIRTIIAHYLHTDLNYYLRLTVDNGSITCLEKAVMGPSVKYINLRPPAEF